MNPLHNPFVGPKPIRENEPFFGRSAEVRDLYQRLLARRIVLLHSPSGAGKSSLIHAGLLPRLREGGFQPWPSIRVGQLPPGELGINRYVWSTLLSVEEDVPPATRKTAVELASLSLSAYIDARSAALEEERPVLIFDQFEEVLSVSPRDLEAKREFFQELGMALKNEKIFTIFVIREDYLGAFAPYRALLPTRLANTWRLDFLGLPGAREAAVQLARLGGRSFPAVDLLVTALSTVQVPQADGSSRSEAGSHVEPVHLQVVCRRLWSAMEPENRVIEEKDVARFGDVSLALGQYYREELVRISAGDPAVERSLREWVEHALITGGLRSQVRREREHSGGLPNVLVEKLLAAYLIRAEPRAGSIWMELAHDQLVAPVLADNDLWFAENLAPLQLQAQAWLEAGKPKTLLVAGPQLQEALRWSSTAPRLTAVDREFLEESQVREAARPPDWDQGRAGRTLFVVLAALLCTALGVGLVLAYADEGGMPPPVDAGAAVAVTAVISVLAYLYEERLAASKENRVLVQAILGTALLIVAHRALHIPEYLFPSLESNVASRLISGDHWILAAASLILGITLAPWALRLVPVFIAGAVVSRFLVDGPGRVGGVVALVAVAVGLHAMSNASPTVVAEQGKKPD